MKRSVLVCDGEQRAALAVVRSLGRAGHDCTVSSTSGRSIAGASRYALHEQKVSSPEVSPRQFVGSVRELVERLGIDVVVPITEPSLLALLPQRHTIPAKIPFPDAMMFQAVCDKDAVLKAARNVGIAVPLQEVLESADDADRVGLTTPLVLKPARSVYRDSEGRQRKAIVRWAHTRQQLRNELLALPQEAYPVLAQQVIDGPGIGHFLLLNGHDLLASFAHRRIREKPPSGGVSVLRQSEPMAADLLTRSVELLRRFQWQGVAMVEYKLDARTGNAYLMEINGRFWGSLQLAIDAGVDFPRMLLDMALGGQIDPIHSYRCIRSRWFWGDVDHTIALFKDPTTGWMDRLLSVGRLIRSAGPGYQSEMLKWRDPAPFVRESMQWFQAVVR